MVDLQPHFPLHLSLFSPFLFPSLPSSGEGGAAPLPLEMVARRGGADLSFPCGGGTAAAAERTEVVRCGGLHRSASSALDAVAAAQRGDGDGAVRLGPRLVATAQFFPFFDAKKFTKLFPQFVFQFLMEKFLQNFFWFWMQKLFLQKNFSKFFLSVFLIKTFFFEFFFEIFL